MPLAPASPDGGAAFSLKTKKMGDTASIYAACARAIQVQQVRESAPISAVILQ